MDNKNVGLLLISVAALMGIIIFLFNKALSDIVATSCTHGTSCPMWGTIEFQTNISIVLMFFVGALGAYFLFKKESNIRKIIEPKKVSTDDYKEVMALLLADEKKVFEAIISSQGTILQSDLVSKTGLGKVKITRILDKLESQNIIERKRRGMTNVVILRHSE